MDLTEHLTDYLTDYQPYSSCVGCRRVKWCHLLFAWAPLAKNHSGLAVPKRSDRLFAIWVWSKCCPKFVPRGHLMVQRLGWWAQTKLAALAKLTRMTCWRSYSRLGKILTQLLVSWHACTSTVLGMDTCNHLHIDEVHAWMHANRFEGADKLGR